MTTNILKIGAKVQASAVNVENYVKGEIVAIETKARGAWYTIKRDIDGALFKTRAAKIAI